MWGAGGSQFLVRKVLQWKEVLPEALGGSETLGEAGLRVTMVTTRAEGVPGCEPVRCGQGVALRRWENEGPRRSRDLLEVSRYEVPSYVAAWHPSSGW